MKFKKNFFKITITYRYIQNAYKSLNGLFLHEFERNDWSRNVKDKDQKTIYIPKYKILNLTDYLFFCFCLHDDTISKLLWIKVHVIQFLGTKRKCKVPVKNNSYTVYSFQNLCYRGTSQNNHIEQQIIEFFRKMKVNCARFNDVTKYFYFAFSLCYIKINI